MSSDEDPIRSVTRADIESRLGATRQAKSRSSSRHPAQNINLAHTATGTTRETRILGGQLGSVSRKRNRIQSSKISWWILGAFIVLIAIALIIPNPSEDTSISSAIEGKLPSAPEPDAIYRESRIDETAETEDQPEASFVRPDDLGRVQAYVEEERVTTIIQQTLVQAQEFEDSGNLSIPAENNAAAMYQKILELDPSNNDAVQGISRILAALLTSASQALTENNNSQAQAILQRMQKIDSENRRTLSLENALNQYQNEQDERATTISELLRSAENSLQSTNILSPPRDNALFYYQQVLSLDAGNSLARGGIERITTQQLELASQSILESDLDAAVTRLNTVETLAPDNSSLALLRAQIDALMAMPLVAQANSSAEISKPEESELEELANTVNTDSSLDLDLNPVETQSPEDEITASAPRNLSQEATVVDTEVIAEQPGVIAVSESDMTTGLQHYYHGRYNEAYETLKPLADRGVVRAQFRLAVMQQLGRGAEQDETAAEDLYRRTLPEIRANAEAGVDWAQTDLASLYEDGMVVGQDIERAFSWYLRAAEQGYSGAQTNLGTLYYYGRGVEKSRENAIDWYRAAADQGDLVARDNLSKLGVK
jgi:hypothetical protein